MNSSTSQQPPHREGYLRSFQAPPPSKYVQTFSQGGQAPYGYEGSHSPQLIVPHANVEDGSQPVYHLKVTATPVQLPDEREAPEYVVSASRPAAGYPNKTTTKDGEIVAHAIPDKSSSGLTIKPLHYTQPGYFEGEESYEAQRKGPSSVHIYGAQQRPPQAGRGQAVGLGQARQAGGFGQAPQAGGLRQQPIEVAEGRPAGTHLLETGYSREIGRPLDAEEYAEDREKIYNWIIPAEADETGKSGKKEKPIAGENLREERFNKGIMTSLFGKFIGGKRIDKEKSEEEEDGIGEGQDYSSSRRGSEHVDIGQPFRQVSELGRGIRRESERDILSRQGFLGGGRRKKESEPNDVPPGTQVVPSATDETLGLPTMLRPSVKYGGIEYAAPEYAGTKAPLNYKLHAIEVHQYIPLPAEEDPMFLRNQINPTDTALFGAMPNPFDLAHTGMVAATFQSTIDGEPTPALCPEMSRMFNHEMLVTQYNAEGIEQRG